jgi:hypothetical protein
VKVIDGTKTKSWFGWFHQSAADDETQITLKYHLGTTNRVLYLHEHASIVFREAKGLLNHWKDYMERISTDLRRFEALTAHNGRYSGEYWKDWAVLKHEFDYHLRPIVAKLGKAQADMISNTKAAGERLDTASKECHQEAQLRLLQGLDSITWEECYNKKLGTPM